MNSQPTARAHRGKPIHVLLVEDDPTHADLVRMSLENNDVKTTISHVSNGEDAILYLRQSGEYRYARRPDIVLLDLKIPRLNGHEVIEQVKADAELHDIPVVVLSTSDNHLDIERAYRLGVNSYMTKPIDFVKFQKMIREFGLYWTNHNRYPGRNELSAARE
jgi:CheY-like chemotaxis protein